MLFVKCLLSPETSCRLLLRVVNQESLSLDFSTCSIVRNLDVSKAILDLWMPLQLPMMARVTAVALRMGTQHDAICFSSFFFTCDKRKPKFTSFFCFPVLSVCSVLRSISYVRLHHFDQDYIDWRDDVCSLFLVCWRLLWLYCFGFSINRWTALVVLFLRFQMS